MEKYKRETDIENKYRIVYCDFETLLIDGIHFISCYSIVNPEFSFINIIQENNITKEGCLKLIKEFIEDCIKIENMSSRARTLFFFHNFSRFDSYFILKYYIENNLKGEIDLLNRNNTTYELNITISSTTLTFRDSFLLCPISLEDLGKTFCKNYKKTKVDHDYNWYLSKKDRKTIKEYCLNDSLTLMEGMTEYYNLIYGHFKINLFKCLSLPSLSLKIYRTRYYEKDDLINMPNGIIDKFIRRSYKGGIVDVYKPKLKNGHSYDVNSLYPYVMREYEFPVEKGIWVKNVEDIDNFFGFVEADIIFVPEINIPFLCYNHVERGLISPMGKWTTVYFSEELKYAKTLGYKFKLRNGVQYKKGNLFREFVDDIYALRISSPKNTPLNLIMKFILNSLYGKLGMHRQAIETLILDYKELEHNDAIYHIMSIDRLNNSFIVTKKKHADEEKLQELLWANKITQKEYNKHIANHFIANKNSAVQVASAITAYARIVMHKYKNLDIGICYSDTDSIICEKKIPDQYISDTELGKLKYEGRILSALFIAPKIYTIEHEEKTVNKMKGVNNMIVSGDDYKALFANKTISKSFLNPFKRLPSQFLINSCLDNRVIKGSFIKRLKIIENSEWVDTKPLTIDGLIDHEKEN